MDFPKKKALSHFTLSATIFVLVTTVLPVRLLPADESKSASVLETKACYDFFFQVFEAQHGGTHKFLSQNDNELIESKMLSQGSSTLCGPACVYNKWNLWREHFGMEPLSQPAKELQRILTENGRVDENGVNTSGINDFNVAVSLLRGARDFPNKFKVRVVAKNLVDKPSNSDIEYENRVPSHRDLTSKPFPAIVRFRVELNGQVMAHHYTLSVPSPDFSDAVSLVDPLAPARNNLGDLWGSGREIEIRSSAMPDEFGPSDLSTKYIVESVVILEPQS